MNDRELLELAAKAAGMYVLPMPWPAVDGWFYCPHHENPAMHFRKYGNPHHYSEPWMPLADDGDALRLAVKLGMTTYSALGQSIAIAPLRGRDCVEPHGADAYAATRRAIVRAAAEIGRQMP